MVITGAGVVSPLGADRETSWENLRAGRRAVQSLSLDCPTGAVQVLGAPAAVLEEQLVHARRESSQAESTVVKPVIEPTPDTPVGWADDVVGESTRQDRMLLQAASEAVHDAAFETGALPEDGGCCIGSSKGNLDCLIAAADQMAMVQSVDPRLWIGFPPARGTSLLSARFGLGGPSSCPVAACATGLFAVITAAEWITDGRCDVALAGCSDASLNPLVLGSYRRMGVLAESNDAPGAVRPFAEDRSGFAVGEGAAVFVLESADHARRRGVAPYAQMAGWCRASDAHAVTELSPTPSSLIQCLRTTLERASLLPHEVGHVNCHGTATRLNDPWETEALKAVFQRHASNLRLTANKSMIGHLLGAAGGVELAFTLLSLRDQYIPPTMNLFHSDPQCDLDYSPLRGTDCSFNAAVKQSIGFGGHLASLALTAI